MAEGFKSESHVMKNCLPPNDLSSWAGVAYVWYLLEMVLSTASGMCLAQRGGEYAGQWLDQYYFAVVCRGLKAGLELLCRAYETDPSHPGILSMLAQVCLKRGDYEKVNVSC
jgi:hypothetical protein